MQTKKHSAIESVMNILIGYGTAIGSQIIIFPWFGINIPVSDNLLIGLCFTVISLARSYTLRRYFNRKTVRNKDNYVDIIAGKKGRVIMDDIEENKLLTKEERIKLIEWYFKCFPER